CCLQHSQDGLTISLDFQEIANWRLVELNLEFVAIHNQAIDRAKLLISEGSMKAQTFEQVNQAFRLGNLALNFLADLQHRACVFVNNAFVGNQSTPARCADSESRPFLQQSSVGRVQQPVVLKVARPHLRKLEARLMKSLQVRAVKFYFNLEDCIHKVRGSR